MMVTASFISKCSLLYVSAERKKERKKERKILGPGPHKLF